MVDRVVLILPLLLATAAAQPFMPWGAPPQQRPQAVQMEPTAQTPPFAPLFGNPAHPLMPSPGSLHPLNFMGNLQVSMANNPFFLNTLLPNPVASSMVLGTPLPSGYMAAPDGKPMHPAAAAAMGGMGHGSRPSAPQFGVMQSLPMPAFQLPSMPAMPQLPSIFGTDGRAAAAAQSSNPTSIDVQHSLAQTAAELTTDASTALSSLSSTSSMAMGSAHKFFVPPYSWLWRLGMTGVNYEYPDTVGTVSDVPELLNLVTGYYAGDPAALEAARKAAENSKNDKFSLSELSKVFPPPVNKHMAKSFVDAVDSMAPPPPLKPSLHPTFDPQSPSTQAPHHPLPAELPRHTPPPPPAARLEPSTMGQASKDASHESMMGKMSSWFTGEDEDHHDGDDDDDDAPRLADKSKGKKDQTDKDLDDMYNAKNSEVGALFGKDKQKETDKDLDDMFKADNSEVAALFKKSGGSTKNTVSESKTADTTAPSHPASASSSSPSTAPPPVHHLEEHVNDDDEDDDDFSKDPDPLDDDDDYGGRSSKGKDNKKNEDKPALPDKADHVTTDHASPFAATGFMGHLSSLTHPASAPAGTASGSTPDGPPIDYMALAKTAMKAASGNADKNDLMQAMNMAAPFMGDKMGIDPSYVKMAQQGIGALEGQASGHGGNGKMANQMLDMAAPMLAQQLHMDPGMIKMAGPLLGNML